MTLAVTEAWSLNKPNQTNLTLILPNFPRITVYRSLAKGYIVHILNGDFNVWHTNHKQWRMGLSRIWDSRWKYYMVKANSLTHLPRISLSCYLATGINFPLFHRPSLGTHSINIVTFQLSNQTKLSNPRVLLLSTVLFRTKQVRELYVFILLWPKCLTCPLYMNHVRLFDLHVVRYKIILDCRVHLHNVPTFPTHVQVVNIGLLSSRRPLHQQEHMTAVLKLNNLLSMQTCRSDFVQGGGQYGHLLFPYSLLCVTRHKRSLVTGHGRVGHYDPVVGFVLISSSWSLWSLLRHDQRWCVGVTNPTHLANRGGSKLKDFHYEVYTFFDLPGRFCQTGRYWWRDVGGRLLPRPRCTGSAAPANAPV